MRIDVLVCNIDIVYSDSLLVQINLILDRVKSGNKKRIISQMYLCIFLSDCKFFLSFSI